MYTDESNGKKDRNEVTAEDFSKWIEGVVGKGYGLDFNASFFTHPMMTDGFSLASRRKDVRDYWIKVGKNARTISQAMIYMRL